MLLVFSPRECWDATQRLWGHLSFCGFFCPWFLLCFLQTVFDVITAKELYRRHMPRNSLFFALPGSESHLLSHQPQDKCIRGPHKTLSMSELPLFAMQSFFSPWPLQSLKPFAKRTSDYSTFYVNERVTKSLCSLPLGKPSPL